MIGFALNKEKIAFARAEADAVVGVPGRLVGELYVVDVPYDTRYCRLAFTKAIYNVRDSRRRKIIDLKINEFEKRRAHLLPAGHPAMTHPRLARAMVNLSGGREILDPFCGGGGILVEAGLCGLKVVGFDIDAAMIDRTRKNLDSFGIRKYLVKKKDATTFVGKYETVVTDLPFGLSTKMTAGAGELYLSFLKNLKLNKITKAVVGFPDFADYKNLVKKSGLKIEKEFTYYLHRSLSKKIVVIS